MVLECRNSQLIVSAVIILNMGVFLVSWFISLLERLEWASVVDLERYETKIEPKNEVKLVNCN